MLYKMTFSLDVRRKNLNINETSGQVDICFEKIASVEKNCFVAKFQLIQLGENRPNKILDFQTFKPLNTKIHFFLTKLFVLTTKTRD